MHLYALGNNDEVLYAGHADKHINYSCLECAQVVRVRSGFHRQPHFYHLQPNHKCRLNGKSMSHLMLQYHLESILPKGEVQLECRFPAINRIADVAWISEKIIFEVQCSPISATEILERNADYALQGYQVVWILHQTRFNQYKVTAAENVLHNSPHYFSNMDGEGKGEIFDQLSFIRNGIRQQRMPKIEINVIQPMREKNTLVEHLPQSIRSRIINWPLYFHRDYTHLCCENHTNDLIEAIKQAESKWMPESDQQDVFDLSIGDFLKKICLQSVMYPYRAVLRLLLERASR